MQFNFILMYNPFDKSVIELNIDDLQKLIDNEICEGWYIEYKREIPRQTSGKLDNVKIAKSISSFANTKGGWIIWGISCDEKNRPVNINGIVIDDFRNFEDQVAQLINSNISPSPIYHFKKIDTGDNKIVFVIQVEESPIPPYVTSQGVIYQRENNESKPIKDRYIIEKLNEKAASYYETIEEFSNCDLTETKGQSESNQSYLELYLFPEPFDSFSFKDYYTSSFFHSIALTFYQNQELSFNSNDNNKVTTLLNLGFNSVYSSEDSLIIRPLNKTNLIYRTPTVELFRNGNLKFLIPIYEFSSKDIPKHYEESKVLNYLLDIYSPYRTRKQYGYNGVELPAIRSREQTDFVNHIKFIDGANFIVTIHIILSKYKKILQENGFDMTSNIRFRAKVSDCWRKFVFFENDNYLEKIKLFNIPLSPKNQIQIPEFRKGHAYRFNLSDESAFHMVALRILEGIGLADMTSMNIDAIFEAEIRRHSENKPEEIYDYEEDDDDFEV